MAHQASATALKRKSPEPEDEETTAAGIICANNGCGFFGAAATGNMCSKCYREHVAAANASDTTAADSVSIIAPSASAASPEKKARKIVSDGAAEASVTPLEPPMAAAAANRCATCRKKVGLLGFRCRCEGTFCSVHRYTDKHHCGFDYKAAGREQIAKHNPVVVADKIATRI